MTLILRCICIVITALAARVNAPLKTCSHAGNDASRLWFQNSTKSLKQINFKWSLTCHKPAVTIGFSERFQIAARVFQRAI